MALVVEYIDPATKSQEIAGVGRLSKIPNRDEAEVAVLISDSMQHRGLGMELIRSLVNIARKENLSRLTAEVLGENLDMQRIFEKLGFVLTSIPGEQTVRAELKLA